MKRMRIGHPGVAVLGLLLGATGCGTAPSTDIWLSDRDAGADAAMDSGADTGTDGGSDAGPRCPGACVPPASAFWSDPILLWVGPVGDPMAVCPEQAPAVFWDGYRDISATNTCPLCSCDPPSCELPSGVVSSTLSTCPNDGPGATLTPFDAPQGWDGSCVSPTPIPSSLLASISIDAPTVSPCVPKTAPVPKAGGSVAWQTMGVACKGELGGSCEDPGKHCAPKAPEGSGLRHCVMYQVPDVIDVDAVACPTGYPEKEVFYRDFVSTLDCSPCSCDPPVGAVCNASVATYGDAACGTVPLVSGTVTLAGSGCASVPPGATLTSMAAVWVTNEPGSCTPSGGEPIGEVTPTAAGVFCCEGGM